jgi:hypothetical protein
VHPESTYWFVHVPLAGTRYVGELGYYMAQGWIRVSVSGATLTPPDAVSPEAHEHFATIPIDVPLAKLVALVKEAVEEHVPLAEALEELRQQGHKGLPEQVGSAPPPPRKWTPAQEQALSKVLSMDEVRRVWMGSLEITELIRRQAAPEFASIAAAGLALPALGAPTSPALAPGAVSSPGAARERRRGFWFTVNAELIVYGATEPNATVTIGGRQIRLRPDGSFSFRFALPDGEYELPVAAVSADETDGRAAELRFIRETNYRGDVGVHAQDAGLKRPGRPEA